jgi:biotin carboxylase
MAARFLIVGGGGGDAPARLRAFADDIETIVLCRTSALASLQDAEDSTAIVAVKDGAPVDRWTSIARRIDEEWRVGSVVSFGEAEQGAAAAIAADLGLPYHSVETVACVDDKVAMRRRLAAAGLCDVPFRQVSSVAEFTAFFEDVGPPVLLKPTSGVASVGVAVVRTRDEVPGAFRRTETAELPGLRTSLPLAERYLQGPEYSVEALSHGGHHYVLAVTEKFKDPSTKVELGHVIPARLPAEDERLVIEYVRSVLTALGVTYGPTHTEVILTARGPMIVETHLRPGGDEIVSLVQDATGVDMADLVIRQLAGEDISRHPDLRTRREAPHYQASAAIRFLTGERRGVLAGVDGWDRVAAHPGVRSARQLIPDGSRLRGLRSSRDRLGFVRVAAQDTDAAVLRAESCVATLAVQYAANDQGG